MRKTLPFLLCSCLLSSGVGLAAVADEDVPRTALKICADPNYMPFSNQEQAGYENQLAKLIADDLGLPLEYTWFPQRLGFIRNTLRKELPDGDGYACDLVMGLPKGYELAITTEAYMQSTYALVISGTGKLAGLKAPAELVSGELGKQSGLRVGVTERSPGADWLGKYGLYTAMAPYVAQSGDPDEYPGEPMFDDLQSGKLDAAILWGPTASYLARQASADHPLRVVPLQSEPGVKLHFPISMGVRFGEGAWKKQLNGILEKNRDKVRLILKEYGIPLVDDDGKAQAS